MGFFTKKKEPEVSAETESIEDKEKRLAEELRAVKEEQDKVKAKINKEELSAVTTPPKEKSVKGPDVIQKEKIYLSTLKQVEDVVVYCREKGWLTKDDWKSNDVPMVELTKKLIQVTKEYVDARMAVIKAELEREKKGE